MKYRFKKGVQLISEAYTRDWFAIRCNSKEQADALFDFYELIYNRKLKREGHWTEKDTQKVYYFKYGLGNWGMCSAEGCVKHKIRIVEFGELVEKYIPKTSIILKLEPNQIISIEGYACNPCSVNKDYELINSLDVEVGAGYLVRMINGDIEYKVEDRCKMTLHEIEEKLGFLIEIVG